MKILTGITSQPKQQTTLPLGDGTVAYLYMEYREQQSGWFANIEWGNWTLDGLRLTASPNLLQKWKNVIPFGLAILTQGDVEPLNVMDFVNGVATVYQLDASEVSALDDSTFSGY